MSLVVLVEFWGKQQLKEKGVPVFLTMFLIDVWYADGKLYAY